MHKLITLIMSMYYWMNTQLWEVASYSRTVIHRNSSHMHTKAAIHLHLYVQVIQLMLASKKSLQKLFCHVHVHVLRSLYHLLLHCTYYTCQLFLWVVGRTGQAVTCGLNMVRVIWPIGISCFSWDNLWVLVHTLEGGTIVSCIMQSHQISIYSTSSPTVGDS